MTNNLINTLQKSFSDQSYQDISKYVGINPESTKNGLKVIIPVVLASILGNNTMSSSAEPIWWNALDSEYPYTEDEFVMTENIGNSLFLVKGREVVSGMFRTNHDELVASVSSVAGVQKEKAAGLIELGVPLIAGYLKNWMRRKNWTFKELIENLIENKATIIGSLPSGISLSNFSVANKPTNNFSKTIEAQIPSSTNIKKKKNNGLIWFGGLLLVALILYYFMGIKSCSRNLNTEDMLVPEISQVIDSPQLYEKSVDGTYYAYKVMPELVLIKK